MTQPTKANFEHIDVASKPLPRRQRVLSRTLDEGGVDSPMAGKAWREAGDLPDNLVVLLGVATEAPNRTWYEQNTGHRITYV